MELIFLGPGTSTGVPQLRCGCDVCRSKDPTDQRLRTSALLIAGEYRILIDCGPDFRQQMLTWGKRSKEDRLDALLVTHQHYDHVGGIDDLRPYCYAHENGFPVYCQADVAKDLRNRMPYCFTPNPYPGVPRFDMHEIEAGKAFTACGLEILPLRVNHYKLEILGFRIGDFAYITDAKIVYPETIERLKGIKTLVINALRIEQHLSHMSLDESLEVIAMVKPQVTYLTHISHQLGMSSEVAPRLPKNVFLAYDNLKIAL